MSDLSALYNCLSGLQFRCGHIGRFFSFRKVSQELNAAHKYFQGTRIEEDVMDETFDDDDDHDHDNSIFSCSRPKRLDE